MAEEKKKLSAESFQPLSRGYRKHLRHKTGNQVKLYIYCLCRVKAVGDGKGEFCIDDMEKMCEELNWNIKLVYKTLKELDGKYLKVVLAKSRHTATRIKVLKYKNVEDFYRSPNRKSNGKSKPKSTVPVSGKVRGKVVGKVRGTVTKPKPGKDNKLPAPNKDNKDNKDNKEDRKSKISDPKLYKQIIDLYWKIAEQHTGRKPVWQTAGAGNFQFNFNELTKMKRPLREYETVFDNGFNDSWHCNKMSPAWVVSRFNELLNLKIKKSASQRMTRDSDTDKRLKQKTERKINDAESKRGSTGSTQEVEKERGGGNELPDTKPASRPGDSQTNFF